MAVYERRIPQRHSMSSGEASNAATPNVRHSWMTHAGSRPRQRHPIPANSTFPTAFTDRSR